MKLYLKLTGFLAALMLGAAAHGFDVEMDSSVEGALEKGYSRGRAATRALENQRKAEQAASDAARRGAANSDMGGALNCARVSKNYGLWNYCETGSCSGFSANFNLWALCEKDEYAGMPYSIWSYLKDGNVNGFTDYRVHTRAKQQVGTYADRKRFVIYYLGGYTYE